MAESISDLIREIEATHGPHIECWNMGCRKRGLSGMHCLDNDDCNEGPHEDCPMWALAARLRRIVQARF